jgi:hypothetical protein
MKLDFGRKKSFWTNFAPLHFGQIFVQKLQTDHF